MIIIGCSNSRKLAEKTANILKVPYSSLEVKNSHNGEMHVKFDENLKNQTVLLFQTLYPHPNHSLLELLFATETAKDLGAKKVVLVIPYFAFLTEDYRKEHGECINSKVTCSLLNKTADEIITIDPHQDLEKIFTIPVHNLSASELIKDYIKNSFSKSSVLIAPGEKSTSLVKNISSDFITLTKKRIHEHKVEINDTIGLENEDAIIIDDIINTGTTMKQAISSLQDKKNVYCIAVHPIIAGNAEKLLEKKAKIISTNTITHHTNQIDITPLLVEHIRNL